MTGANQEARRQDDIDVTLRALAHSVRRQMLRIVRSDEHTAGDLARQTGLSGPAASQHLKVLRDARLVTVRTDGTRRLYRLDPAWLAQLRSELDLFWGNSLEQLKTTIEGRA